MKPLQIATHQPRMRVLNREQARGIHTASLQILEEIGFKMEHPVALSMLADAGAKVAEPDWVKLPAAVVEKAIKSAPRQIDLYDQHGNIAMQLANGNSFYGTGSDATFTVDLETGERRRTLLRDVASFARLVDGLDNMAFAMSMANPEDVPIEDIYLYVFAEMVKNTSKPIVFIADSGKDIARIHEIACHVASGEENLRRKPFLLNYSEAISPLRFPHNVMEKLISVPNTESLFAFLPVPTPAAERRSHWPERWRWESLKIWSASPCTSWSAREPRSCLVLT